MFKLSMALLLAVVTASIAQAAEFPFAIAWDQRAPGVIEKMSEDMLAPAGRPGLVQVSGDSLVFGDSGDEARFWGVGLAFSGKKPLQFPPKKPDAAALVAKLRSFGFNHVRFVGFDNNAPEPFRAWLKTGRLDSETMDRFDYFVSELKKVGIYYSVSINNNAVILLDEHADVVPNDKARMPLWRFKYIRLYEQPAIERITAWYRAFYGHVNPYTGLTYAKDPANVYVSSVNEDSIFDSFFHDFKDLGDGHKAALDERFAEFLLRQHGSLQAALDAWLAAGGPGCGHGDVAKAGAAPEVLGVSALRQVCQLRMRDTVEFLIKVDGDAGASIKAVLDELGYKGLFSVTNNWYGYGALAANRSVGDYIDLHGYYDHPRRTRSPVAFESVDGDSLIAMPGSLNKIDGEHSYPLSRAFRAASPAHPLLFSEWGVGAWGDFGYEGPLMHMAYAAFQGYPLLDAHTYFNHPDPDPKDVVSRYALTVSGNGVFMSLSPSLSLAFRRGDITSPAVEKVYRCAETREAFLAEVLAYGLKRTGLQCGFHVNEGYVNKLRTELYGSDPGDARPQALDYSKHKVLTASSGEIVWRREAAAGGPSLSVDAPRFKAAAVPVAGGVVDLDGVKMTFHTHGAVTLVSLDGRPLGESENMLITTVQSFRNTDMRRVELAGGVRVLEPGRAPMLMKTANVRLDFKSRAGADGLSLCAVMPDGDYLPVQMHPAGETKGFFAELGHEDTPWYWLGRSADGQCGKATVSRRTDRTVAER